MSVGEKLKALDLGPGSIDDAELGMMGYDGLLELRDALPQIVAVVEALETATDWYDRAAHSRPRPDWIESGGVALAALDEALS